MSAPELIFDRDLLVRRRTRAAQMSSAGDAPPDFLLARVAEDLEWRLGAITRQFPAAVVIGGWHGLLAHRLRTVASIGEMRETESCPAMLAGGRPGAIVANEEALPFAEASLDLVVCGLTLQWANDLPGALIQIRRALRPDGLMLAALIGGRTLFELREALLLAEAELEGGASPRVAPFADVRDLGAVLQRARFALPVTDVDTVAVTYADPIALMRELRAMGAGNVLVTRRRTPLRRATLARACAIYAERHGTADGRIRATFEIVTLTGWAPHESQPKPLAPGSARTRLSAVLGDKSG